MYQKQEILVKVAKILNEEIYGKSGKKKCLNMWQNEEMVEVSCKKKKYFEKVVHTLKCLEKVKKYLEKSQEEKTFGKKCQTAEIFENWQGKECLEKW